MSTLLGHTIISGVLHCDTGLRIGGSKDTLEIGGTDSPIIRNPVTRLPYIPGSSIKGKIRSLLELRDCKDNEKVKRGSPCDCGKCKVCTIFGCGSTRNTVTVSRAIFRDCSLTEESIKTLEQAREEFGIAFSESKTEVAINRQTGKAISPRVIERIPEGIEFDIEIVLRKFEEDSASDFTDYIKEGLKLLQNDSLGGSGTRGYGKVTIKDLKIEDA